MPPSAFSADHPDGPTSPGAGAASAPDTDAVLVHGNVDDPVPVDLRDYVTFDPAGAAGRRVFTTDVVAVDLVCLEPGQVLPARAFPTADAIYTVLGGRAWVVTDDAEVTLDPLQSVMVPATVPHGLRNASPDPLILQVVISPPDEAPAAAEGPTSDGLAQGAKPSPVSLSQRLRRILGG